MCKIGYRCLGAGDQKNNVVVIHRGKLGWLGLRFITVCFYRSLWTMWSIIFSEKTFPCFFFNLNSNYHLLFWKHLLAFLSHQFSFETFCLRLFSQLFSFRIPVFSKKLSRNPKSCQLCRCYLVILTVLEIKTEKF